MCGGGFFRARAWCLCDFHLIGRAAGPVSVTQYDLHSSINMKYSNSLWRLGNTNVVACLLMILEKHSRSCLRGGCVVQEEQHIMDDL